MVRLIALLFLPLLAACASMNEKIAASRQERCEKADWKLVGQRDGVEGVKGADTRYAHICGDLFQPGPYSEGLKDGLSRRPPSPGM